ncbi:alpha/beta fold hydrolase [Parachitinimonas caeni]|uniref:Alpha/beta hydrolase n=1 Tax=Parachitinimonas caeni TaxID=3031301 RepID=A0ABT7DRV4_9NEIS|nr:alpha/beta hydrolase [Parachitinimonas caeni]MDK2122684.1 alpha/beta hydrolase [Parachitinimonas caeni]
MKKSLLITLVMAAMLGCGAVASRPHWADLAIGTERWLSDLHPKQIEVDGHVVHYLDNEASDKPVLLLLHGFGADADNWTRFARQLDHDYRIIAPDLPGFGATGYQPTQHYGLQSQVARLKALVDKLGIQRFHLVGNSMGGYIAAEFAVRYPDQLSSLGLFDAAGVDMPVKSPFYHSAMAGKNLLLVSKREDVDKIFQLVFHVEPFIPGFMREHYAERQMKMRDGQARIFEEIFGPRDWLENRLSRITVPTLIMWGDRDKVVDPSSIPLFQAGIRQSVVEVIPDCGHLPMVEQPAEAARRFRRFLQNLPATPNRSATAPPHLS